MTRLPSLLRPLFPWVKAGALVTIRMVSPVTRRVPGDDSRPTPPRHIAASTVEYQRVLTPAQVSR